MDTSSFRREDQKIWSRNLPTLFMRIMRLSKKRFVTM